ncbi:unnamed protein product [Callosobruchus maculatus]|uniref:VWFD domain-containing protein n=1 Tax=Callosobruchus maculatus TaxID=64391 RepID=A0A653DTP5_CALMS|nr:unnamed protein product [Callosobruchus maculatus]
MTKCSNVTCPEGTRPVATLGDCCKKCVEIVSNCMVYGNLHYKTFDGKMYDLNGIGKYQMVADCSNNTFSIRVANSVRNIPTLYSKTGGFTSFFTKRVAIRFGDVRMNLQQRGRIKYNGRKINAPFKEDGKFRVEKRRENVELILNNGVRIFWNGRSLVDVTVPPSYKNKLCGLCGNYNSNLMDDLTTKQGKINADIKTIVEWGLANKVQFNVQKTQATTLTKKSHDGLPTVEMEGHPIVESPSVKLLGININNNMSWHDHVVSIAKTASQKLVVLFRFRKLYIPEQLLLLYKAQIRPSLEFYHGRCSSELSQIITPKAVRTRNTREALRAHPYQVEVLTPRTSLLHHSFFWRTSTLWNQLPGNLFPDSYNLKRFKSNAYVRDCERRLGITIPYKWQKQTACDSSSLRKPKVTPRRTSYFTWDYNPPLKRHNITRSSAASPIPIN